VSAVKEVLCPSCRKKVAWTEEAQFRPFCSKRCQLIDFGDWAMERHRIPQAEAEDFADDEQEGGARPSASEED
jgi:endogenous inhibitor of DNA gyrase (YacG/DUF329 family)